MNFETETLIQANSVDSVYETNGEIRGINKLFPGVDLARQIGTMNKEQAETVSNFFGSARDSALANIETLAELLTAFDASVITVEVNRIGYLLSALTTEAVAAERLHGLATNNLIMRNMKSGCGEVVP